MAESEPFGDSVGRLEGFRHLRRLRDIYLVAQALVLAILLYGFYWSATSGPLHDYVFKSFFSLLGFLVFIIFTPLLVVRAFPPPFPKRMPGVSMKEALQVERIKVSLAVIVAAILANQIIFSPHDHQLQNTLGYLLIALSLLVTGWILRDERMGVFWNFWRSAKGRGKGQGWKNLKQVFRLDYWDLDAQDEPQSVRLKQENKTPKDRQGGQ